MGSTPESGVDRLYAHVKPRWDRERHERVFAAIIERIRREEGRERGQADARLRLSHAAR